MARTNSQTPRGIVIKPQQTALIPLMLTFQVSCPGTTRRFSYSNNIMSSVFYTPDIRSMLGYIVFAFPLVRSYICSFVFPSHRVKVFALKFIKPHILKTL